ncbi:hypothetical protein [Micromonospora psammae]|uniref:hypothetical protein n=1 Tax=Micromonospora sp. CPCC 205556 TaxID=3122398 RepID=UPI002FF3C0F9
MSEQMPQPGSGPGVPRWVTVIGIVVGALVLLLVLAQLTGIGVGHGPGRHLRGLEATAVWARGGTPGLR